MEIKIRHAKLSDIKILNEFQNQLAIYERPFSSTIKKTDNVKYYNLKKLITSNKVLLLVAEIGNDIIGCGFGEIRKNKTWSAEKQHGYVGLMFVKKSCRSKGVGKILIDKILEWFKSKRLKDIRLEVYDENIKTVKFYKRLGFKNHVLEMIYEKP